MEQRNDPALGDRPAGGCPRLTDYDPLSLDELRDPYPSLRAMRDAAPVWYSPSAGYWSIARQADVLDVLRDPKRFSSRSAMPVPEPPPPIRHRLAAYPSAQTVLFMDDPHHRPARAAIQAPFTPRNLKALAPQIRDRADRLLGEAEAGGRIEFVQSYALPLALAVIGDICGVPEADFARIEEWIDAAFRLNSTALRDDAEILEAAEGLADYYEYLCSIVEERRSEPREDFTSVMLERRQEDGSPLSTHEVAIHLHTLVAAGFETSAQMMAHGMSALLRNRDQWEALKADRSLIDGAVTECLRYRTLVKRIFRVTTTDVEIREVAIPADSVVCLLLASANHDEAVYEHPERFDIRRPQDNLAFGKWKHYCCGAHLARLEMKVTLEAFLDRFPDATVVDQQFAWRPDIRIDALLGLDLQLRSAVAV